MASQMWEWVKIVAFAWIICLLAKSIIDTLIINPIKKNRLNKLINNQIEEFIKYLKEDEDEIVEEIKVELPKNKNKNCKNVKKDK